jgi:uncharacterized integral membrane protein
VFARSGALIAAGDLMRFRTFLLIAIILVIAAFVALNFEAILQPTSLNLGMAQIQAPLGLVMLGPGVLPDQPPHGSASHHAGGG